MEYLARARSVALVLVLSAFSLPSTWAAGPTAADIEDALLGPADESALDLQALDPNQDGRVDVGDLLRALSPDPTNAPPELDFVPHDPLDVRGGRYLIVSWIDRDPDDDARIDLFYDDGSGALPIVTGISENDPRNFVVWDTAGLAPGGYSVFAVIDDGNHPAIRIDHSQSFAVGTGGSGSEPIPLAHWPMDDPVQGAGQWITDGAGSHDALTQGATLDCTYASDGGGACLLQAASGDHLVAGTPLDTPLGWYRFLGSAPRGFSLRARVFLVEGAGLRPIVSTSGFALAVDPDGFAVLRIGGEAGPSVRSRAPIPLETWTSITAVVAPGAEADGAGGRLLLFVGAELHAQLWLSDPMAGLQSDTDLYIGRGGAGDAAYFEGLIDDIAVFGEALTPEAIEADEGAFYRAFLEADGRDPDDPNHGGDGEVGAPNIAPALSLLQPASELTTGGSVTITWSDSDPDDNATIQLYYEAADGSGVRLPINAVGIAEDDESDRYNWDTTGLASGSYYVLGSIDDGRAQETVYAPGLVVVPAADAAGEANPLVYLAEAEFRLDDDVKGAGKRLVNSILEPGFVPPDPAPRLGRVPSGIFDWLPSTTGGVTFLDIAELFSDAGEGSLTFEISGLDCTDCLGVSNWALTGTTVPLHLLDGQAVQIEIRARDAGGNLVEQRLSIQATGSDPALGNHAPMLVVPFGDITLDPLSGAHLLDLAGRFIDPDGDRLTFEAIDPAAGPTGVLKEVAVDGDRLRLQPGLIGTTRVEVRASDGVAPATSHGFQVTVATGVESEGTAPLVIGPVDDFRLGVDEHPRVFDLRDIFMDPDGDPLAYSLDVDHNNAGKLDVRFDEGVPPTTLTIDALREGGADNVPVEITLRATDSTGAWVREQFTVRAKDNRVPRCLPGGEPPEGADDSIEQAFLDLHFEVSRADSDEMPIDLARYCYDPDGHYPLTVTIADKIDNRTGSGDPILSQVAIQADPNGQGRFAEELGLLVFDPARKTHKDPVKIVLRLEDSEGAVNADQRVRVVVSERRPRFQTVIPETALSGFADPYDFDGDGHAHALRLYYDADVTGVGGAGESRETLKTRVYVRRHRTADQKAIHGGADAWVQCGESEPFTIDGISVELDEGRPETCTDAACTVLCELDGDFLDPADPELSLATRKARDHDIKLILCPGDAEADCGPDDGDYLDKAGPADKKRLDAYPMEGVANDIGFSVTNVELAGDPDADANHNGYYTRAVARFDLALRVHESLEQDLPEEQLTLSLERRRSAGTDWKPCGTRADGPLSFDATRRLYTAVEMPCDTTGGMERAQRDVRLVGTDAGGEIKLRARLGRVPLEGSDRDEGVAVTFDPDPPVASDVIDLDGDGAVSSVTFEFDVDITAQDANKAADASRNLRVQARWQRRNSETGAATTRTCAEQSKLRRITGAADETFRLTCAFDDEPPPGEHDQDTLFLRAINADGDSLALSQPLALAVEGRKSDRIGVGLSDAVLDWPDGSDRDNDGYHHAAHVGFTIRTTTDAAAESVTEQVRGKVFIRRHDGATWHRCGDLPLVSVTDSLATSIECSLTDSLSDLAERQYDVKVVLCLEGDACRADNNAEHFSHQRFDNLEMEGIDNDPYRSLFVFRAAPATQATLAGDDLDGDGYRTGLSWVYEADASREDGQSPLKTVYVEVVRRHGGENHVCKRGPNFTLTEDQTESQPPVACRFDGGLARDTHKTFLRLRSAANDKLLATSEQFELNLEGRDHDEPENALSDAEVNCANGDLDGDGWASRCLLTFAVGTRSGTFAGYSTKVFIRPDAGGDWRRCGGQVLTGPQVTDLYCVLDKSLADYPRDRYDMRLVLCRDGKDCTAESNLVQVGPITLPEQFARLKLEGENKDRKVQSLGFVGEPSVTAGGDNDGDGFSTSLSWSLAVQGGSGSPTPVFVEAIRIRDGNENQCARTPTLSLEPEQQRTLSMVCAFTGDLKPRQDKVLLRLVRAADKRLMDESAKHTIGIEGVGKDRSVVRIENPAISVPTGGDINQDGYAHRRNARFDVWLDNEGLSQAGQPVSIALQIQTGSDGWAECGTAALSLGAENRASGTVSCALDQGGLASREKGRYALNLVVCAGSLGCGEHEFPPQPMVGLDRDSEAAASVRFGSLTRGAVANRDGDRYADGIRFSIDATAQGEAASVIVESERKKDTGWQRCERTTVGIPVDQTLTLGAACTLGAGRDPGSDPVRFTVSDSQTGEILYQDKSDVLMEGADHDGLKARIAGAECEFLDQWDRDGDGNYHGRRCSYRAAITNDDGTVPGELTMSVWASGNNGANWFECGTAAPVMIQKETSGTIDCVFDGARADRSVHDDGYDLRLNAVSEHGRGDNFDGRDTPANGYEGGGNFNNKPMVGSNGDPGFLFKYADVATGEDRDGDGYATALTWSFDLDTTASGAKNVEVSAFVGNADNPCGPVRVYSVTGNASEPRSITCEFDESRDPDSYTTYLKVRRPNTGERVKITSRPERVLALEGKEHDIPTIEIRSASTSKPSASSGNQDNDQWWRQRDVQFTVEARNKKPRGNAKTELVAKVYARKSTSRVPWQHLCGEIGPFTLDGSTTKSLSCVFNGDLAAREGEDYDLRLVVCPAQRETCTGEIFGNGDKYGKVENAASFGGLPMEGADNDQPEPTLSFRATPTVSLSGDEDQDRYYTSATLRFDLDTNFGSRRVRAELYRGTASNPCADGVYTISGSSPDARSLACTFTGNAASPGAHSLRLAVSDASSGAQLLTHSVSADIEGTPYEQIGLTLTSASTVGSCYRNSQAFSFVAQATNDRTSSSAPSQAFVAKVFQKQDGTSDWRNCSGAGTFTAIGNRGAAQSLTCNLAGTDKGKRDFRVVICKPGKTCNADTHADRRAIANLPRCN